VTVVFILMVLTADMGWVILPVEGNPYSTAALCQEAKAVLLEERITRLAGLEFSKAGCLKKEVLE